MASAKIEALLLDTETTGTSPEDQVIEMAWAELPDLQTFKALDIEQVLTVSSKRFRPTVPINEFAFKVHGIKAIELVNCPDTADKAKLPVETKYLIGHNINFDHRMLKKPEVLLICTLKLAKIYGKVNDKPFTDNKLVTLVKEFVGIELDESEYHSAPQDVLGNLLLLQKILRTFDAISSWDELYAFQESFSKTKKGK